MSWIIATLMAASLTVQAPAATSATQVPPPPPAVEGAAEFSYVGTSGNSDTRSLGAGLTVKARTGEWVFANKTAVVRNEDRGVVKAQSFTIATQATREWNAAVGLRVDHDYARDRFAGVLHRNALGGGLSWKAVAAAPHTLTLDAGVGYVNEQRLGAADLSTAIGTLGAVYGWVLSPQASFENDLKTTISLTDAGDQWVRNVASLSAKLNSRLSLKVSHTTKWAKSPVPGFRKTDTIASVALVAKF